jgi:hypothetical protein
VLIQIFRDGLIMPAGQAAFVGFQLWLVVQALEANAVEYNNLSTSDKRLARFYDFGPICQRNYQPHF